MAERESGYVLWLGGIFGEETMLRRPGVNPSARKWMGGLVRGLERQGTPMRVLGHAPEPLWPKGRFRDAGADPLDTGLSGEVVGYWNLPAVRMKSLARSYRHGFRRVRERWGEPALVLGYNAYPYNVALGREVQRRYGIPWVCIVADVPEPGRARERHDAALDEAAGRVFLSWAEFSDAKHAQPKLHLDGGIERPRFPVDGADDDSDVGDSEGPILLYAGSFGRWGGVRYLLDAFARVRRRDARLWVCGHGDGRPIQQAAERDPRIRYFGLVSEERLERLLRDATVLVNPRPSSIPGNAGNFPSKLFEYLSYGKPVVSTWTPGIAPEYRGILAVVEPETVEGMAATIEDVLSWSAERRRTLRAEIRDFIETRRSWDAQAARLSEWLRREVLGGRTP